MISLEQVKEALARLEENDAKLLAALNEIDGKVMGLGDGIALELGEFRNWLVQRETPATKQKNRARGTGERKASCL